MTSLEQYPCPGDFFINVLYFTNWISGNSKIR